MTRGEVGNDEEWYHNQHDIRIKMHDVYTEMQTCLLRTTYTKSAIRFDDLHFDKNPSFAIDTVRRQPLPHMSLASYTHMEGSEWTLARARMKKNGVFITRA